MSIKIENISLLRKPSAKAGNVINKALELLPREHLRGIERIRIVDSIDDPRVRNVGSSAKLPGLYHPKQGSQRAWAEIALNPMLEPSGGFIKRAMAKMSFKSNVAALTYSLIGQHYYLTLRHSVKKTQLEQSVLAYVRRYHKEWATSEHKIRARIFKPLQPTLEKWARALQSRTKQRRRELS